MFRQELPRLYEMKDRIVDPASPNAYFQNFDTILADSTHVKDIYLRLERVLQELDDTAWLHLKEEACKRLNLRDALGRGWQQLFDILNEARAYRYLKSMNCTNLRFIPRSAGKTPDLECLLGLNRVLCEVKTINISDEEVAARTGPMEARSIEATISTGFIKKLRSTIATAEQQMQVFDPDPTCIRFVYLNISFDDFLAQCKQTYFKQIDDELLQAPIKGVRLVFCNERTPFYEPLSMQSADVDNLGEV